MSSYPILHTIEDTVEILNQHASNLNWQSYVDILKNIPHDWILLMNEAANNQVVHSNCITFMITNGCTNCHLIMQALTYCGDLCTESSNFVTDCILASVRIFNYSIFCCILSNCATSIRMIPELEEALLYLCGNEQIKDYNILNHMLNICDEKKKLRHKVMNAFCTRKFEITWFFIINSYLSNIMLTQLILMHPNASYETKLQCLGHLINE